MGRDDRGVLVWLSVGLYLCEHHYRFASFIIYCVSDLALAYWNIFAQQKWIIFLWAVLDVAVIFVERARYE